MESEELVWAVEAFIPTEYLYFSFPTVGWYEPWLLVYINRWIYLHLGRLERIHLSELRIHIRPDPSLLFGRIQIFKKLESMFS